MDKVKATIVNTDKFPRAKFSGELLVGESALPAYVLDDDRRVFSTTGMLVSLDFNARANADEVFNASDIKPFLPQRKTGLVRFVTDTGRLAKGYDVEHFMDICHAFSEALEAS